MERKIYAKSKSNYYGNKYVYFTNKRELIELCEYKGVIYLLKTNEKTIDNLLGTIGYKRVSYQEYKKGIK